MDRVPGAVTLLAYKALKPKCQHCESVDGITELVDTGNDESLDGFELWFRCRACLEAGRDCETFVALEVE
jgi:hypothetical protein